MVTLVFYSYSQTDVQKIKDVIYDTEGYNCVVIPHGTDLQWVIAYEVSIDVAVNCVNSARIRSGTDICFTIRGSTKMSNA